MRVSAVNRRFHHDNPLKVRCTVSGVRVRVTRKKEKVASSKDVKRRHLAQPFPACTYVCDTVEKFPSVCVSEIWKPGLTTFSLRVSRVVLPLLAENDRDGSLARYYNRVLDDIIRRCFVYLTAIDVYEDLVRWSDCIKWFFF